MAKKITLVSSLVFIIDQIIKLIVVNSISLNENIKIINNFFSLTYVRNYGAGFSILEGQRVILILVSILVIIGLIYYLFKNKNIKKYEIILYSILIGGILGNLFDRVVYGYVIDYLYFILINYHYPVFNFADMCIVLSIITTIILELKDDFNENKSRK